MSKKKRRQPAPDPDRLPPGCFRCSKCGRPWLIEQGFPHKTDTLCFPCHEAFQMAVLQALDAAAEAEHLMQEERRKHAKHN